MTLDLSKFLISFIGIQTITIFGIRIKFNHTILGILLFMTLDLMT